MTLWPFLCFLDIDGVCNNHPYLSREWGESRPPWPRAELDATNVAHLNVLVNHGVEFVLSSMWRHSMEVINLHRYLMDKGLSPSSSFCGKTPTAHSAHRGSEIQQWLTRIDNRRPFVILDDDRDMEPYMDRLIQTDREVGLTAKDVQRAVALLTDLSRLCR